VRAWKIPTERARVERKVKTEKEKIKRNEIFFQVMARRHRRNRFIWLFILITLMNIQSEWLFLERKMRIMRVRALSRAEIHKITFVLVGERKIFRSEKIFLPF
jgi:hypothetical protein